MRDFSIDIIWAKLQMAASVIGGWIGYFVGGVDGLMTALLIFMILDYITGLMCAVADKKLSSSVGFKGICKKVLIFILVGIAHILDVYVIGGGSIYRQLLPYCDTAYVTKVHAKPESDTFFQNLDEDPQWQLAEVLMSSEENGILVQPGDYDTIAAQVCACIENPAKAKNIAQAGRETAQNMTWNHNAQKLLALFQELITR